MSMGSPSAWLFASDNSRYSTRARLLFMGLSFAIGILTFLLYLAVWYLCHSRRSSRQGGGGQGGGGALFEDGDGMSDDAIAALPATTFLAQHEELDCAVCLGQAEAGEEVRRLPKCAHAFHAGCVDAWLRAHATCPMCRAAVGSAAAAAATKQQATTTTSAAAEQQQQQALPPV